MTTKVRIDYPTPNHKPFSIRIQEMINGEWVDSSQPTQYLDKDLNHFECHIWETKRLVIEEMP